MQTPNTIFLRSTEIFGDASGRIEGITNFKKKREETSISIEVNLFEGKSFSKTW